MAFGRVISGRARSAGRAGAWISAVLVALIALLSFGATGAGAQEQDLDVTVTPGTSFPASTDVTVTIADLGDFDGGRAVIYQCGNADAFGAPIDPTEGDCFPPENETNYLVLPIEGDEVVATYPMRLNGIGDNNASCVTMPPATGSCQLVVAVSKGGDAILVGVPVDDLVTAGQSDQLDGLPVTGSSAGAKLLLSGVAALLLYIGWFAWSAASPARQPVRVESRRDR